MIKIRLQTKAGELVTYGLIPPFQFQYDGFAGLPVVIVWGIRHFLLEVSAGAVLVERPEQNAYTRHPAPEDTPIYSEIFTIALVAPIEEEK